MKKLIFLGLISAFADCSAMDDTRRQFAGLESSLHKRLPFQCSCAAPALPTDILQNSPADQKSETAVYVEISQDSDPQVLFEHLSKSDESNLPIHLVVTSVPTGLFDDSGCDVYSWSAVLREDNFKILKARTVSVTIPADVENIPDEYFADWKKLTHVAISGSSLKTIGARAFAGTGIREIHIPDSVEEMGDKCFYECELLSRVIFGEASQLRKAGFDCIESETTIYYPQHIEDVIKESMCSAHYLRSCKLNLVSMSPAEEVQQISISYLDSEGACHQIQLQSSKDKTLSLWHIAPEIAEQIIEIKIPNCVEVIDHGCFRRCKNLKKVVFEDGAQLKSIKTNAFGGTMLEEIHIPNSVEEIGKLCFYGCRHLSQVKFDDSPSLKRIGARAFFGSGLREIYIPNNVVEIGNECFSWCRSLYDVIFDEDSQLTRIGAGVFMATGIRAICIPDRVVELGEACFAGCGSLYCIGFDEDSQLTRVGKDAFDGDKLTAIRAPGEIIELIQEALGEEKDEVEFDF